MFDPDFLKQKAKERKLTETETETFLAILNNIGQRDEEIAGKLYCHRSTLQSRMTNIYLKFGTSSNRGPGKKQELIGILNKEYPEWKKERNKGKKSQSNLNNTIFNTYSQDTYYFNSAPDVSIFYGCTEELEKLRKWVIEDNYRLIAIHGVTGVGKTYLVRRFADTVKNEFQCAFWHSLPSYSPHTPKEYLTKLLHSFHEWFSSEPVDISEASFDDLLNKLMYYLTNYRCLLILDNFQYVLKEQERVGTYEDTYQGYRDLLLRIGQSSSKMKSCLLLNSWDKPQGLAQIDTKAFKTFQFKGSEETCQEILSKYDFSDPDLCQNLIEIYDINPLLLKGIAEIILTLYEGKIERLLGEGTYIIPNHYYISKIKQLKRLSSFELEIIRCFPDKAQTLSFEELRKKLGLSKESKSKLLTPLDQSLFSSRSLVNKTAQGYNISPLIKRVLEELYS